jgi:monoamine oxidase
MKRKDFIKQTGLLSAGLLFPYSFLSACRKDTPFEDVSFDGKVFIIGAGAAGLYAANILKSKGISFQILEATDRVGGRLAQRLDFADFPIDLGAQWLHGKNNILGDLIGKTDTPISLDNTELTFWFNNQRVKTLPKNIQIFEGDGKPDISYQAYAEQQGLGDDYKYIVEAIAGDQGASADKLSVYYNNLEEERWSSGEDDYKFRYTFFDLIHKQIAEQVRDNIVFNTPIKNIDYSEKIVVLTDLNENTYTADKVIITVPISILRRSDIHFVPELPDSKVSAFSKIGMEAGMKVFLKFSDAFFDENILGGTVCAAYIDERTGKASSDPVLMAFIMGRQAEALTSMGSNEAIVNALLNELDSMYNNKASSTFLQAHVENWTTHPYIRGAYSYSTVGMGDARKIAAQSVDQKLYFAGEAMNLNGHHQTVHGAVETGYREVMNMLKDIKK